MGTDYSYWLGFDHIVVDEGYSNFRASIDDMEYLENQCADDPQDRVSCDYQEYENQDLGFPDLLISGVSKEEVRRG